LFLEPCYRVACVYTSFQFVQFVLSLIGDFPWNYDFILVVISLLYFIAILFNEI